VEIFSEATQVRKQAKLRLSGWVARVQRSSVRCFDSFLKTLKLHKEHISNDCARYWVGAEPIVGRSLEFGYVPIP